MISPSLAALSVLTLAALTHASALPPPKSPEHQHVFTFSTSERRINGLSPHAALHAQLDADASALELEPIHLLHPPSAAGIGRTSAGSNRVLGKRRLANDSGKFNYGITKVRGVSKSAVKLPSAQQAGAQL